MRKISKRYEHFVFGVIQSGLTCLVATAIALSSQPIASIAHFARDLLYAWALSWATMLPVVMVAAPAIRNMVNRMTYDPHRTTPAGDG
ncbi:MAG: DUF2798 domain-containing protein [Panacagrimonas sp.]